MNWNWIAMPTPLEIMLALGAIGPLLAMLFNLDGCYIGEQ